ncbi:MAG: virulence protein RhuM/Fic/DOC family protein [Candidatus Magasanikbacteria bacterium]|nr:virulence protein RhuM/Fic/DOC family protein [Candidatus Magasanikbacteria bacterium]
MIIYRGPGKTARLEVRLRDETVWLTQKQMAELFSTERSVITKHLHNIFASHELEEKSNVQKMHIPMSDKPVKLYNLDVTISLGYRVNSQRATQFRIWATKILRDHIVRGYTINDQRLREHGERLKELQKAIAFMQSKARQLPLAGQAPELLSVIQDYAASLTLLYEYDRGALALRREKHSRFVLSYDTAYALIEEARAALRKKREASDLFGQEYGDKFKSIIGSLYQTFGGKKLYATVEETTAHLLYLTIKDHPFADGNKRIASLLFIYYLQRTNYLRRKTGERKISDTTLVALALLVAESDPKEKDVMIRLITNLLQ